MINALVGTPPAEASENPTPDESQETRLTSETPKPSRLRVWDRDILKDIPAVQAFKQKSAKERGQDTDTSKRLSIATGAIARGRALKVPDKEILTNLIASWPDPAKLHSLYTGDPSESSSSSDDGGKTHVLDKDGNLVPEKPDTQVVNRAHDPMGLMDKARAERGAVQQAMELSLKTAPVSTDNDKSDNPTEGDLEVQGGKPTNDEQSELVSQQKASVPWGDQSSDEDVPEDSNETTATTLPDSPSGRSRKRKRGKKGKSKKS
jgi:hypothetical protein